jgi:hypothetical protein
VPNPEQEVEKLVPLVLVAAETGESLESLAARLGEAVDLDSIGMRCIPATVAQTFLTELREQRARQEERLRLHQEQSQPVPAGIPRPPNADPTLTAHEVQRLADAEAEERDPARRINPQEEFLTQRLGPPRTVEEA